MLHPPGTIFLTFDGSHRAQKTLAAAIAVCRRTRARLGVAAVPLWPAGVSTPWVHVPFSALASAEEASGQLRNLIPDDVSVRFLTWPHHVGLRDMVALAGQLGCDTIMSPHRGWRARRLARLASASGLSVYTQPSSQERETVSEPSRSVVLGS